MRRREKNGVRGVAKERASRRGEERRREEKRGGLGKGTAG